MYLGHTHTAFIHSDHNYSTRRSILIPIFSQEQATALKLSHPHIRTKMVKGAGHHMVLEVNYRDTVVEVALEVAEVGV